MLKLFWCDVETTGTDSNKHGLIQLSAQIYMEKEKAENINLMMKPFESDEIDPKALESNRRTEDEIKRFHDPQEQFVNFIKIVENYVDRFNKQDKFHFIGYNAKFDDDFVRAWFKKCGDNYYGSWFYWPPLDVANMAGVYLMNRRHEMKNFKLMTVAEFLGIEVDEKKAHDAMYDIEITRQIAKKIWKKQYKNGDI